MIDIENYELWNIKSINNSMPPIIRLEYDLNLDKKEIILHKNLNKNLDDLSIKLKFYETTFNYEVNILNKLLIKNFNALRKDVSMNLLKKLKKLLSNYQEIDIFDVLKNIEKNDGYKKTSNYFLSREFYEFLLVKFYSIINLLKIILNICKTCSKYLLERIYNAIYIANNVLFLSCVARIYTISKRISIVFINCYNYLRKNLEFFKSTNLTWNPIFKLNDYPIEIESNEIKNEVEEIIENEIKNDECLDLGVVIRREDHQPQPVIEKKDVDKNDNKWKRILFKYLKKILNEEDMKKRCKKFIKKKLKKFGRRYALFMIRIRKLFIKKFKCKKLFVRIKKSLLDDHLK
jgi:hypothetical protein